jgi:hypothetical protein
MAQAAAEWRQRGAPAIPAEERDAWVAHYFDLLASAFAAQPPPSAVDIPKRGGRRQQSPANNQAERDLRMFPRPAKDRRDLSQRGRSDGFLSHS